MNALDGKVALITGGSEGFGRGTALGLARLGAKVVIVCRTQTTGEQTLRDIAARTGHSAELILGDLSTTAGVHAVADAFLARHRKLHILVNNVGTTFQTRRVN